MTDTSTAPETAPKAKWTVCVYFAADNDLDNAALDNLRQMKKVGSSDLVNIVAQLDTRSLGNTYRFRLRPDSLSSLDEDVVGEPFEEVNTGDPETLSDFLNWAIDEYPAEHVMLIIWGHGLGWQPDEDSRQFRAIARTTDRVISTREDRDYNSIAETRQGEYRAFARTTSGQQRPKVLSREEAERIISNPPGTSQSSPSPSGAKASGSGNGGTGSGVAMDSTSQDALTVQELGSAISNALTKKNTATKYRNIDILGLDACLMAMTEVGYQVCSDVNYLVASEDTVPIGSWPYDKIFAWLVENVESAEILNQAKQAGTAAGQPNIKVDPLMLAGAITSIYIRHYSEQGEEVTQSICDLSRMPALVEPLKDLAEEMTERLEELRVKVLLARSLSQSFYIEDFVDLHDFCRRLWSYSEGDKIGDLCRAVIDVLRPNGDAGLIAEFGYNGRRVRSAFGASIYFPCGSFSEDYGKLYFAEKTQWGAFLQKFNNGLPKPVEKKDLAQQFAQRTTSSSVRSTLTAARFKPDEGTHKKVPELSYIRRPGMPLLTRPRRASGGANYAAQASDAENPKPPMD